MRRYLPDVESAPPTTWNDLLSPYQASGAPQHKIRLYWRQTLPSYEPPQGLSILRVRQDAFIEAEMVLESELEGLALAEAMHDLLLELEEQLQLSELELLRWTKRLALARGQSIDLDVEPRYARELSVAAFRAQDRYGEEQEHAWGPEWRSRPLNEWEQAFRDENLVVHAFGQEVVSALAHASLEAARADFRLYRKLFEEGKEGTQARVARLARPGTRTSGLAG